MTDLLRMESPHLIRVWLVVSHLGGSPCLVVMSIGVGYAIGVELLIRI